MPVDEEFDLVVVGAGISGLAAAWATVMPGYGWVLNDQKAADLMSYLRGSWGNQAAPVTAEQVKNARALQQR